ncbi:MAG: excinuclease ABC subunit C, partial [Spirochaetia bacterium]|nr:excinuclease ABC subunit C [Spirochaetia bacterium]
MREAATRRYTRVVNEGNPLPDLILIDGGIGQVNAVQQVLNSLEIDVPVAGLAKRDEEIWLPGASQPVCLPKRSDALRLLQRVRDETHRFATSRNQELRTKENTVSPFINLPGVGKERDRLLMKKFATLEKLSLASESEIAQTLHVNSDAASKILLSARELLAKQNAVKEKQKLSLGQSGTTKEKAEHAQKIYSLAQMALEEKTDEKDGSLKVASPE